MIPQCCSCGSPEIEYMDEVTGEILPDWLVDARGLFDWDESCEPALLRWQDEKGYTDEDMEDSVDGLINSERYSGPKPKGYPSPSKALQRRVRMGYDRPAPAKPSFNTNGARATTKSYRY